MPSDRKFHMVVIEVTVLSEYPIPSGVEKLSLSAVAENIDSGDDVGRVKIVSSSEIDARRAVQELKELGSEPGFFQLTEDGEDAE
jgi:hypothetical protein